MKMKLSFIVLTATVMFTSQAFARNPNPSRIGDLMTFFQGEVTNYTNNEGAQTQQVLDLLQIEQQNCLDDRNMPVVCQFPAFPRVWHEMTWGKNQTTKIAVNSEMTVTIPGIFEAKAGVEVVPYNYSYGSEISMQVAGSRSLVDTNGNLPPPNQKVSDTPIDQYQFESFTVVRKDAGGAMKRYYRVVDKKPMIGFCTFRMTLRSEVGWTQTGFAKASFPGLPFSGSVSTQLINTEYEQEGIMLQSQFFQIRGDVDVDSYFNKKCREQFLPRAKQFVQQEFDKIVLIKLGRFDGNTQCLATSEKTPEGDTDCNPWFFGTQHPTTQFQTVPRCKLGRDNPSQGQCRLRLKEKMPCTLYRQPKTGKFTETYSLYAEATSSALPHIQCDEGYKCTMDSNPTMLGPLIIWPGRATCKPK